MQENQQNATVANPDSHMAKYLAEAESLCRIVASLDLAGHPIYIVAQSQLESFFGQAGGCYAYTTPSLDLYVRDHIDDWQGRGPCMVINDLAIAEDHAPDAHRELVLNHTLHELAHILDRPSLFEDRNDHPDKLLFEALVVANTTSRPQSTEPIYGHRLNFIRIAIHLVDRANRAGFDIRHSGVCATHRYGLAPIANYVDALGDEPSRSSSLRFQDIVENDTPNQFNQLWTADLNRGEKRV